MVRESNRASAYEITKRHPDYHFRQVFDAEIKAQGLPRGSMGFQVGGYLPTLVSFIESRHMTNAEMHRGVERMLRAISQPGFVDAPFKPGKSLKPRQAKIREARQRLSQVRSLEVIIEDPAVRWSSLTSPIRAFMERRKPGSTAPSNPIKFRQAAVPAA